MKTIIMNDPGEQLGEILLNAIPTRHVCLIRNFRYDQDRFIRLTERLGEVKKPPTLMYNDDRDQTWFNSSREWPLHFDGILTAINKPMPITLLHATRIENLKGGVFRVFDLVDVYDRLMGELRDLCRQIACYQRPDGSDRTFVPLTRTDHYSEAPYIAMDEWFFHSLGDLHPQVSAMIQREIIKVTRETPPFEHQPEQDDLLVWSNEGFVHERTRIESGVRWMTRGLAYERRNHKEIFRPIDASQTAYSSESVSQ